MGRAMMAHQAKKKQDAARNFAVMAEKLGVTVPAAWPSGTSQLMQAYAACQRCVAEDTCADFLAHAPEFHPIAAGVLPQRGRIYPPE